MEDEFNTVFVNCMLLNHASHIYGEVSAKLGARKNKVDIQELANAIISSPKKVLLILDEIHNLHTDRSLEHLLNVFKLPDLGVCLIGVSNMPDLIQEYLQGNGLHILPEHLQFSPYKKHEIQGIIESRLEISEQSGALAKGAVSTVAQNICNSSADVRKALRCCAKAMELVERQWSSSKIQVGVLDVLKEQGWTIFFDIIRLNLHQKYIFTSLTKFHNFNHLHTHHHFFCGICLLCLPFQDCHLLGVASLNISRFCGASFFVMLVR